MEVELAMNKTFKPESLPPKEWAKGIGIEFIDDFSPYEYIQEKKALLPYDFASKHCMIALGFEEGKIIVAVCNPYALEELKEARFLLKAPLREVLSSRESIEKEIETLYFKDEQSGYHENINEQTSYLPLNLDKEYDLLKENNNSSVVSLLNNILIEALRAGASDIHFEPTDAHLLVKFRVDGMLFTKHSLPKHIESQIITRLKVQAELDIAESRMPQDGRIKLRMGPREIDFRLSTVPVIFGERVVLRISDNNTVLLGLDNLDLKDELLASLKKDIKRRQGIILVTGPTGSGKTRTLYSALTEISGGDLNIMTIEDPVENKLSGMAQINTNHKRGLTFAKGLKHILRQDPDVIMIGEIRDKETVDIAIEASLTGHLVFSTLHTNDAPSTIIRLIDMGVEPYLISSSLISICSQRLVRMVCTKCKNTLPAKDLCTNCLGSGFKGRRAIYEYLSITDVMKRAITGTVDAMTLMQVAKAEGMKTLFEDGLSYVDMKVTTLDEIRRVTSSPEEN